jgi:hypothetical protein
MTYRITDKMLENCIAKLNRLTGNAPAPWSKDAEGRMRANLGAYYLDAAYGGVNLAQMVTEGGGITCPLGQGMRTKRELFGQLEAMITGIELREPKA